MTTLEERKKELLRRRRSAYEYHANAVRRATKDLDRVITDVDGKLEKLKAMARDPRVLVRTSPGPAVEVYHSAENPCGKVNPTMVELGRYNELLLGEALERGLRPCSACASTLKVAR